MLDVFLQQCGLSFWPWSCLKKKKYQTHLRLSSVNETGFKKGEIQLYFTCKPGSVSKHTSPVTHCLLVACLGSTPTVKGTFKIMRSDTCRCDHRGTFMNWKDRCNMTREAHRLEVSKSEHYLAAQSKTQSGTICASVQEHHNVIIIRQRQKNKKRSQTFFSHSEEPWMFDKHLDRAKNVVVIELIKYKAVDIMLWSSSPTTLLWKSKNWHKLADEASNHFN